MVVLFVSRRSEDVSESLLSLFVVLKLLKLGNLDPKSGLTFADISSVVWSSLRVDSGSHGDIEFKHLSSLDAHVFVVV